MAIRFYNYTLSCGCYKVRLLLDFLGLEWEPVPVAFYPAREHKQPAFLDINPMGQLPVLEDGGLRLRDAQAILTYLAEAYDANDTWLPKVPAERGEVMQWLFFAAVEMAPVSAARLHDTLGYDLDIAQARAGAHRALQLLDDHLTERMLEGSAWLAGTRPSLADIACFAPVALAGDGGIGLEPYPALRNWLLAFRRLDRFKAMPGVPEFA